MRSSLKKDFKYWALLILLVVIGIGFFMPISPAQWLTFFIKIVLFIGAIFIVYRFFFLPDSDVFDKYSNRRDESEGFTGEEIDEENKQTQGLSEAFRTFSKEFINSVRTAMVASCVGFYLMRSQNRLVLQAGENDQESLDQSVFIDEDDRVQDVINRKIPVLEGRLENGSTLAGFVKPEIRSFLGIPLIWNEERVGVLALGSSSEDHFSEDDQILLMRFGTLITRVMAIYHHAIKWEMDREVYRVHVDLVKAFSQVESEEGVYLDFIEQIKKLFTFDRFTCCVKEGHEGLIHFVYGQIDELDHGVRFPLDEGLNGWVLKRQAPLLIPDMQEGNVFRPRYFKEENTKHGLRSFLGVPLGRGENIWGCLSLESRYTAQYGERAKEVLLGLTAHLESARDRVLLKKQIQLLGHNGSSNQSVQFKLE